MGMAFTTACAQSLICETQGATSAGPSLYREGPSELLRQCPHEAQPGRLPYGLPDAKSRSLVLHIKFVRSRALAQPNVDSHATTTVGPVLCCIREQFIQNQRERHYRLFRQRGSRRFAVDRYFFAKRSGSINADTFEKFLPADIC